MRSLRRSNAAKLCPKKDRESVGSFHERTKYTAYVISAASAVPLVRHHHRVRRQARSSFLSAGCSGAGRQRRLRMNAAKQKNKIPAENLDRSAPPKARPNLRTVACEGDCHMLAKAHKVRTANKVIAISVKTRGPKASMAGIVA